ncbi:MAG: metallophosphoesterase [Myxococcota bacterium]
MSIGQIFPALAFLVWLGVPIYAAIARGRLYAAFAAVVLSFALPGALILHDRLREIASGGTQTLLDLIFAYSMAAAGIQLAHLVRAKLRGPAFRWLISAPGQTFIAGGMLAGPWLLLLLPFRLLFEALGADTALGLWTGLEALPLVVAVLSIATSITAKTETVRFALAENGPEEFERLPLQRIYGEAPPAIHPATPRPLRIVQLTDTHLGPWQSVERLRKIVEELAAREPDLVALTGDFLTMESMGTPGCLEDALRPLEPLAEKCVAIFGNHDHEAPEHVRDALKNLGIRLLIDEEACFETPAGQVQVVGSDFVGGGHAEHLDTLLTRFPRRADHLRLLLLHDPVGFHALPAENVDLVLSGHTHGGQVGLVSLGIDWTALTPTKWPDQGLFAKGRSRLYVHRGTGFYGFPLRVGVPAEHSVLEIQTGGV